MELCKTTVFKEDLRHVKIGVEISIAKALEHISKITLLEDITREYVVVLENEFNERGVFSLNSYTVRPILYDPMTFEPKYSVLIEGSYVDEENTKKLGYSIVNNASDKIIKLVDGIVRSNFTIDKFEN